MAKEENHKAQKAKAIDNVKAVSAVAYLGVLFFVPMVTKPKSEYAMFHANQGLLLLLAAVAVNIVGWAIPVLGWFLILPIGSIFILVLFIMGILNALNGTKKRLPVIGKWDLLKPEA